MVYFQLSCMTYDFEMFNIASQSKGLGTELCVWRAITYLAAHTLGSILNHAMFVACKLT
jgi:hypothetical protein